MCQRLYWGPGDLNSCDPVRTVRPQRFRNLSLVAQLLGQSQDSMKAGLALHNLTPHSSCHLGLAGQGPSDSRLPSARAEGPRRAARERSMGRKSEDEAPNDPHVLPAQPFCTEGDI